jgi:hypothetical protein
MPLALQIGTPEVEQASIITMGQRGSLLDNLTGEVMAFSTVHPSFKRIDMVLGFILYKRPQSESIMLLPRKVK